MAETENTTTKKEAVVPIEINYTDFEVNTVIKSMSLLTNHGTYGPEAPSDNKLAKVEISKEDMDSTEVEVVFEITITNKGDSSGYVENVYSYLPAELKNVTKIWDQDGEILSTDTFGEIGPGESVTKELTTQGQASQLAGVKDNSVLIDSSDDIDQRILEKTTQTELNTDNLESMKHTNNYSESEVIVSIITGFEGYNYIILGGIVVIILSLIAVLIRHKLKHKICKKVF